ncbi:NAD(P)/FAD-dependent oxidoreductase [Microbacterium resistens]|uniref:NAD(P)/FAD-dependent oxidoreductase n=1 Tax=Microbacterium resistens TaxID=156977 RepID=A0ABY3RXU6_9MICO|nr:NAD(P)/FAD-dependent oxidoreductase [Microbacterium resistens]UGS27551.1 NAD(P)/FAD-dependent oxidoreductase [Microbacterium resistens]
MMTLTDTTTTTTRDPHLWVPQRKVDDLEWFRRKYAEERDKRLPNTGADTYQAVGFDGDLAAFDADPHATGTRTAPPCTAEVDVLIIGAGFMGMSAGIELTKRGRTDFLILDVAADFGGTWYWNRYPGVRCDVESYVYLPYLEDTGYIPTERYVRGSEIFAYCQSLAKQFDLYERALFQTRVTGMEWDEAAARWIVRTDAGDAVRARFVSTQSGTFSRPQLPGIPGIETFAGHSFHTSRWDYDYTGGDITGNLEKLRDKRVAIIGTGATGVQAIPQLAEYAQSLVVFQRTPTQIAPRENAPTDLEWFRSLPEGWHQARRATFDKCAMDRATADCEVDDGWIKFAKYQLGAIFEAGGAEPTLEQLMDAMERSDYEWNEMLRDRVDAIVEDPEKAEKLKSYYRTMCKRPGFSDDFLPAFNRDSVTIVDTSETPIDRITERGIVVGDHEYEVDLIVFATGFQIGRTWTDRAGYDVVGRDGRILSEKFATGTSTYHGFLSEDFPNLFFLGFVQSTAVSNIANLIDHQARHMVYMIDKCLTEQIKAIQPTSEAEAGWNETIAGHAEMRRDWNRTCTPGQYNNEGRIDDKRSTLVAGLYGPGYEYFDMLQQWREDDRFDGLALTR